MRIICTLACALISGTAGSPIVCAADPITIAGSTTVKTVVDAAVPQFRKKNPSVDFVIGAGGSGQGIQLIGKGSVNIGMSSRNLSAEEKAQSGDLVEYRVGLGEVQAIYCGQTTSWKDLSGSASPIVLYTLNSRHGTHDVFAEYFGLETSESGAGAALIAAHRRKGDPSYSAATAKALDDPRQVLAAILTNPNALGYVSVGIATVVAENGASVRLLELDSVVPSAANVLSGAYKLSRPPLLITKGEASGKIRDFIDFLSGPERQAIVRQMDYIPVTR